MDLNRAMVNLYKQKSSANRAKESPARKPNIQPIVAPEIDDELASDSARKKPRLMSNLISSLDKQPTTTFDQLFGVEHAKHKLVKILARFKRAVEGTDITSQWPYLICGSQGLGKTAIVESAANHIEYKLISVPLKKLVRRSRDEWRWLTQHIVGQAIMQQPSILLIDDLHCIGEREELKYQIQDIIENILESENKVLIFCTSLTPHDIKGIRFHPALYLKRPDLGSRVKILQSSIKDHKNLNTLTEACIKELALSTPSFTASDLKMVIDDTRDEASLPSLSDFMTVVDLVRESFIGGTYLIGERPSVTWSDIGGLPEVREAFSQIREELKRDNLNVKFAGIALHGPPGCGKTMVAQAMANEAGLNFISIKPAVLVSKYLGETERNIRKVFSEAREYEPCIIYFDEFDGLCGTRSNKDNLTGAIQTLLSEMDGFASRGKSIVLVSTNRLDDIDPAMKRPGRLSKHIYVGPPNRKARKDIMSVKLQRYNSTTSGDTLEAWSGITEGMTGAELDLLVYQASISASKEYNIRTLEGNERNLSTISSSHFDSALRELQENNEEFRSRTTKKSKSHC